jgi:hypothetical protein
LIGILNWSRNDVRSARTALFGALVEEYELSSDMIVSKETQHLLRS